MKTKVFTLLSIIPLLLSSCSFKGDTESYRNGEIMYEDNLTYETAFVDANFYLIDSLIKAEETFTFYITNKNCASCTDFKDKITSYIKDTKQLIYRFDISTSPEDLQKLGKAYSDFFFPGGSIVTPQVYVFSAKKACQFVKNTRYETTTMFANAMKEYVYETNVYNISTLDTFNKFIEKNDELVFYAHKRTNTFSVSVFKNEVRNLINRTNKVFALVDIDRFSEADAKAFYDKFGFGDFPPISFMAGYYKNQELVNVMAHEKQAGDIHAFLADLL